MPSSVASKPVNPLRRRRTALVGATVLATVAGGLAIGITHIASAASVTGQITGMDGKCIGLAGGATANGTRVDTYSCQGSATQQWTIPGDSTIRNSNRCLDVAGGGTADGTAVQIYDCNGTGAQQWRYTSDRTLVNDQSGKCLDLTGNTAADLTPLQIWSCTSGANQKWTLPGGANPSPTPTPTSTPGRGDLMDPHKKDIALQLVSSAENSDLNWRKQYRYIQDIGDGRGYTAGIIGFCSGTGDMLEVVERYTRQSPNNVLAKYLPALRQVNGSASHAGLDPGFPGDWQSAANDPLFQAAQDSLRDEWYFNPAVDQAKRDGLRALGQFIYFDAIVMHGPGEDGVSFGGIRKAALAKAKPPAQGGDEVTYLNAFLDARVAAMRTEEAHSDTSRVDTAQRVFLNNRNLDLNPPLSWKVYGDPYYIAS